MTTQDIYVFNETSHRGKPANLGVTCEHRVALKAKQESEIA